MSLLCAADDPDDPAAAAVRANGTWLLATGGHRARWVPRWACDSSSLHACTHACLPVSAAVSFVPHITPSPLITSPHGGQVQRCCHCLCRLARAPRGCAGCGRRGAAAQPQAYLPTGHLYHLICVLSLSFITFPRNVTMFYYRRQCQNYANVG